uniref:VQ domain-containing protein n=1 Tax=Physcomitrium patens TaxID=3218 RepID=A0A7I3Z0I1_PHYPA|nr:uncharacterized protein LOC112287056 [Physcomitrium patens]|eukprot:XP_024385443.1 uncharacterized protein LOC112287056 [Physcomitrella patens]
MQDSQHNCFLQNFSIIATLLGNFMTQNLHNLEFFWKRVSSASISHPPIYCRHAVRDTMVYGKMEAFKHSQPAEVIAKKKRKRPSKKIPTTVFDSTSDDFINLVQKLTGSPDERAAAQESEKLRAKCKTETPMDKSLTAVASRPSSSLTHAQNDTLNPLTSHHTSSDLYYQLYLRCSNMTGSGDQVDSGFPPYCNYNPTLHSSAQYKPSVDHFQGAALSNGLNLKEWSESSGKEHLNGDLYRDHDNRSKETWDALCPSSSSTLQEKDPSLFSHRSDQMNHPFYDWYSADQIAPMRA